MNTDIAVPAAARGPSPWALALRRLRKGRLALVGGPVVFIAVGAAGVWTAGAFLAYPDGLAKPLIKVIEWALLPSLALTLGLIMAGAPERPEDR